MGSRRRNWDCCPGGCLLYSDSFNRADSLILGESWYEPAGYTNLEIKGYCPSATPGIGHGALHAPYGGNAGAAIWVEAHPRRSAYMEMSVYILDDQLIMESGLMVELMLGVEYDPAGHDIGAMHVARLTYTEDEPTIALFTRVGLDGATIELADDTVVGPTAGAEDPERASPCDIVYRRLFLATLTSAAFCASVSHAPLSLVQSNPNWSLYGSSMRRWYSGIGLSSLDTPGDEDKELYVDNWGLWDVYDNNPDCGYCGCGCGNYVMPAELTVTAHGDGCMSPIEGLATTLEWNRLDQNWQGTLVTPCTTWTITLTCPSMEPPFTMGEFRLAIYGGCTDSDPCGNQHRTPSWDSTCDPLDLRFGAGEEGPLPWACEHAPWAVQWSDLACAACCEPWDPMQGDPPTDYNGTYWFEVTE